MQGSQTFFPSALQQLRIYTDQNEKYEELIQKKVFSRKTELFATALVVGLAYDRKSEKKPKTTNILDFNKVKPSEMKDLIYLIFKIICDPSNIQASCGELLRYADGGVIVLWDAYQNQGVLDLPSFIEETKKLWPERMKQLNILKRNNKLEELIGKRESREIEYKSSMIWDYNAERPNKQLMGEMVVRALASFMNFKGGVLIIGVEDKKHEILGLGKDLKLLSGHSIDEFEQHFTNLIEKYLQVENVLNASIEYKKIEGKTIAIVDVPKKAPKPVFFKRSQHDEDFYIRANNTSRKLPPSKIHDYIRQHWPELYK